MKYKDFMKTEMFINADVIDYLDENYNELDVVNDEVYFDCEVIEANKSECTGMIEIILKVNSVIGEDEEYINEVEFKAGYYEWHIYINGNFFYAFDDGNIGDDIWSIKHPEEYEEEDCFYSLEDVVDFYIDGMQKDLEMQNEENTTIQKLDEKYIPELKRQMIEEWSWHYGVEE